MVWVADVIAVGEVSGRVVGDEYVRSVFSDHADDFAS